MQHFGRVPARPQHNDGIAWPCPGFVRYWEGCVKHVDAPQYKQRGEYAKNSHPRHGGLGGANTGRSCEKRLI